MSYMNILWQIEELMYFSGKIRNYRQFSQRCDTIPYLKLIFLHLNNSSLHMFHTFGCKIGIKSGTSQLPKMKKKKKKKLIPYTCSYHKMYRVKAVGHFWWKRPFDPCLFLIILLKLRFYEYVKFGAISRKKNILSRTA